MNWSAPAMLTKTHRCTQKDKSSSDIHSHNHDAGLQSIISSSFSRQIQFLSKTYVSWLKEPTKTGEICHILQGSTQYWVLLCWCLAFRSLSFLSSDLFASPDGITHPFQPSLYLFLSLLCDFPSMCPWKGKHITHDGLWKSFYDFIHVFPLLSILTDWNCALVMSPWWKAGRALSAVTLLSFSNSIMSWVSIYTCEAVADTMFGTYVGLSKVIFYFYFFFMWV